jgi:uncharacterized protein (TIGR03435 family)
MIEVRKASSTGRVRRDAFARIVVGFLLTLLTGIAGATQASAQVVHPKDGEAPFSFEVATVKPNASGGHREHVWINDNSYRIENLTLRQIIRNAYGVQSDAQLMTGSDPVLDSRFDLNAKVDDNDFAQMKSLPREDRVRAIDLMLQSLLTERFHLKVHFETKELPVFALVVDKGGPKFEVAAATDGAQAAATAAMPAKPAHNGSMTVNSNSVKADLTAYDREMYWLVGTLSRQPEMDGRIVVDKTGLTGRYDYSLHWAPQRLTASSNGAAPTDVPDGPSLFTALREQLGLKLESQKADVEILVVDHVEAPSPN